MVVVDKASNRLTADFTEIVRFEVQDTSISTKLDVNEDGEINILDLVVIAQAFGTENDIADINDDGVVNILDLVAVANAI